MVFGAALGFIIGDVLGSVIGFLATIILVGIDLSIPRPLLRDFFACFAGLTFGLIVASLIIYIIRATTSAINPALTGGIVLSCAYCGNNDCLSQARCVCTIFSYHTRDTIEVSNDQGLGYECDYRWTYFRYLPNGIY